MKFSSLTYIFIIALLLPGCREETNYYDVIIVGGGVSGLAAYEKLNTKNKLIIEKEPELGGRVKSLNFNGYFFDVGADYVLHEDFIHKLKINEQIMPAFEEMAYLYNNQLYSGKTPEQCLRKIPEFDTTLFKFFRNPMPFEIENIPQTQLPFFNVNIQSVFPGSLLDYNYQIYHYSLTRYNSSKFIKGNGVIVSKLAEKVSQKIINTTVTKVIDNEDFVEVEIEKKEGERDKLFSKKVIITTPGFVTKSIVEKLNDETLNFLNETQYASYFVLTFVIKKEIKKNLFAYILPVQNLFSNVVLHKTEDSDVFIIQFYVANHELKSNNSFVEREKIALNLLKEIWEIEPQNIFYKNEFTWPWAGVLIDETYLKHWSNEVLQPSKNVYLAGDYTWFESTTPYGMVPAILSGQRAAGFVNSYVNINHAK